MNVTGLRVAVDWSECFILNGPLDTYVLLENELLIYEGLQDKRDLGERNIGGESSWSNPGNENESTRIISFFLCSDVLYLLLTVQT